MLSYRDLYNLCRTPLADFLDRARGVPWQADVLEKRANVEVQAAHLTQDTKKRTFQSLPFSALFAPKTER